ncbi:MAG: hypothetical protein QM811_29710 [Pirellulales bacterium]
MDDQFVDFETSDADAFGHQPTHGQSADRHRPDREGADATDPTAAAPTAIAPTARAASFAIERLG